THSASSGSQPPGWAWRANSANPHAGAGCEGTMMVRNTEAGGVLIGALLVGLLLAMLGGVAMNLAITEATAASRHVDEKTAQLLAESGVEQVVAWVTEGALPAYREASLRVRFTSTPGAPDVTYDAARPEDER